MTNEKKFAIILWIRNEEAGKKQQEYLRALKIPDGYRVDVIEITEAVCPAEAYEAGRTRTDAKYKVYLDEDAVIVHENFLADILRIFSLDASIGMIGMVGTEKIPTNGVCAWANKRIGKIIDMQGKAFDKGAGDEEYKAVMAVDGFLMVTQYDVPWRADLFQTDVFWDTAQCVEYKKAGYEIVVPKQEEYWCIAPWTKKKMYDTPSQQKFLDAYSKEIYPLVSVVIPTYNRPEYFRTALESVLAQTYRNLEIFVTDDSDTTETKELIQEYLARDGRITYEHHPEFDWAGNWGRARSYNNPAAPYVNWLMDDDVFMPDKISQMVDCYEQNDGIALVTSYRELIDADGNTIQDPNWTPTFSETARVDGTAAGRMILVTNMNYIGELTTGLIKKEYLRNNNFGFSGEEGKYLVSDYPIWLVCLQHGDLYYLKEPLSKFRQHNGQAQRNPKTMLSGVICMGLEIQYAWQHKLYLTQNLDFEKALLCWVEQMAYVIRTIRKMGYESEDINVLKRLAGELLLMDS